MPRRAGFVPVFLAAVAALLVTSVAGPARAASPQSRGYYAQLSEPSIPARHPTRVLMIDVTRAGSRVVAVGTHGIIVWSDDNGQTWHQAKVPVSPTLTAVQFVNAQQGWAVGQYGVVLHTADGGKTWTEQLDGLTAAQLVLKQARAASGTSDAAKQALKKAETLAKARPERPLLGLHFTSARDGYVVGAWNSIYRTTDGGKTWQPWQEHLNAGKGWHLYGRNIYAVQAVGSRILLAGEGGFVQTSAHGEDNFTPLQTPYQYTYFGIVKGGPQDVVLYGMTGTAYWSGDGGQNWQKVKVESSTNFSATTRLKNGTILLADVAGEIFASHDGGKSFKQIMNVGQPVTGMVETADGHLVITGSNGVSRVSLPN
ncbi:MAG TPA: YCF48-related protein [Gammaproteobacteria bacterium]|nr:YCF48-related protein [Gammaproteobacteria bacterium]